MGKRTSACSLEAEGQGRASYIPGEAAQAQKNLNAREMGNLLDFSRLVKEVLWGLKMVGGLEEDGRGSSLSHKTRI